MTTQEIILEKLTVRNFLAILLVGTYSGMWAFVIQYSVTNTSSLSEVLQNIGDFVGLIGTMTVLVTLVVQFYFRTSGK